MNKKILYNILKLAALLFIAILIEQQLAVRNNMYSIPLIILFWLGVAYLMIPRFFKKYRIWIMGSYGIIVFFYVFTTPFTQPEYEDMHRLNFINIMLVPIPVFLSMWLFEQWRWLQTLKADKAKAELTLLKNQVNPHFFFNTLNNLYGLVVEQSKQAPEMVLKLSDIMRYNIYEAKEDYVPIKDELQYLQDYIELQKIRYQQQVNISLETDIQHAHQIAPLLLIVPLENAFKHGVHSLTADAYVDLKINTTTSSILYEISNNYESSNDMSKGIGLDNLRNRLALIYPDRHQLEIIDTDGRYQLNLSIQVA